MMLEELVTSNERWRILYLVGINLAGVLALKATRSCPGKEASTIYPLVSLISVVRNVSIGILAVYDGSMYDLASSSTNGRLRGDHAGFDDLSQLMFAYEVWNTLSAIIIPQYRTPEFLGHHIVTGIIAKASQSYGPAFYGLFYFGLASTTTILLVFGERRKILFFLLFPRSWSSSLFIKQAPLFES